MLGLPSQALLALHHQVSAWLLPVHQSANKPAPRHAQEVNRLKREAEEVPRSLFMDSLPRQDGERTWHQDQHLTCGEHILKMQADGNLVIYRGHQALWATGTGGHGNPPYRFVMQEDNNAVIYGNGAWQVVWASHTNDHGARPARLVLHRDTSLVIYDAHSSVLWRR